MKTTFRLCPTDGLKVKKSRIDGKGCFAVKRFPARTKIAEYGGQLISRRLIADRLRGKDVRHIRISSVNSYWAVDGSRNGNELSFVNHSCQPNCFTKVVNDRLYFFALRNIEPGEEILLDYELSFHEGRRRCKCGAINCKGNL